MKIKVILFDIDGTLLNTTELIYQAFEHSLKTHGHNVLSREKMAGSI
ncbi:HAD hydrolase-like protein, partial [Candidatus Daviesbacteria bacterium]|nr:HAD hydrolase-like protein [Candidatus Daviesbacteria bacterium]